MTYLLLLSSGLILGLLLRSLTTPFILLAERSIALLDIVLSNPSTDTQLETLTRLTKKVVTSLVVMVLLTGALFFGFYCLTDQITLLANGAVVSFKTGLLMTSLISVIPLLNFSGKKARYSEQAKLLHRMILNNFHIGRALLRYQVRNFDDSFLKDRVIGLIVSGLARSGTTAVTMALARSNNFSSLDYSNMPFVLSPRLWKKLYQPSTSSGKNERAHGDGIQIGYNEIEALEEVFFINLLNGDYIKENVLEPHTIPADVNGLYRRYIKSLSNEKLYLAKNNNWVLREKSFMELNPDVKVVVMFREPVEHALSLLTQHERFVELHTKDEFVLEYMNFIGHHEFGLGMKPFNIGNSKEREIYPIRSVNFWLVLWLQYYSTILRLEGVHLVCYEEYCSKPNEVLNGILQYIGVLEGFNDERSFEIKKYEANDADVDLRLKASKLYTELCKLSVSQLQLL